MILIIGFILLHMLAIAEGLATKGKLTYSHHMIRFIFHIILLLLFYELIS